jgi:hypothetical protein
VKAPSANSAQIAAAIEQKRRAARVTITHLRNDESAARLRLDIGPPVWASNRSRECLSEPKQLRIDESGVASIGWVPRLEVHNFEFGNENSIRAELESSR